MLGAPKVAETSGGTELASQEPFVFVSSRLNQTPLLRPWDRRSHEDRKSRETAETNKRESEYGQNGNKN
ncbi:hypothetical protein VULLAG_LOCUS8181 [Vulpes lagopus]